MVQLSHISTGQISNPVPAKRGLDVAFNGALVFFLSSGLAMLGCVFLQEAIGKLRNRYGHPLTVPLSRWVTARCP